MAFEADCGVSTVLEAYRVASAPRFPVPEERSARFRRNMARASGHHLTTSRGPRDEALRNSATPTVASRQRI